APHAVGRHVADVGPLRIDEADSAARAADQLADRLADPVEDPRHLEAGADELARRVERRELVLPPVAFREEPSQLDRRRERPAELADDLDVLVVEGSRASRGQRHGTEDATSRQEWHQRHGAVAALRKDPPAHLGDPSLPNVVHPEWRAARGARGTAAAGTPRGRRGRRSRSAPTRRPDATSGVFSATARPRAQPGGVTRASASRPTGARTEACNHASSSAGRRPRPAVTTTGASPGGVKPSAPATARA